MKGVKYDAGKNRLELIPTELIKGVGQVLTFGAQKYEAENWRKFKPEDHKRLVGAAMRHLEAYRDGEYLDPESGLPHLAHIATNMGFLLHLDKREIDVMQVLRELIADLKEVQETIFRFDAILAITRGGLVPATYIAHALGIKTIYTCREVVPDVLKSEHLLIVDDISDSGNTLKNITKQLNMQFKVATVFKRYNTDYSPDYYGKLIENDDWINFPWETNPTTKDR